MLNTYAPEHVQKRKKLAHDIFHFPLCVANGFLN